MKTAFGCFWGVFIEISCFLLSSQAYLTDLNGGIDVEDSEVDWVMKESRSKWFLFVCAL